jgi:hypothetical protein
MWNVSLHKIGISGWELFVTISFFNHNFFFLFRNCRLSGQEFDITTPTTPYMPQLNTPTFTSSNKYLTPSKPNRPSSLNVPASLRPSEALAKKNVTDIAGVNVVTPSNGMFNFDSLMEGGEFEKEICVNFHDY